MRLPDGFDAIPQNYAELWRFYQACLAEGMPVIAQFDTEAPICQLWMINRNRAQNSCNLITTETAAAAIELAWGAHTGQTGSLINTLVEAIIRKLAKEVDDEAKAAVAMNRGQA